MVYWEVCYQVGVDKDVLYILSQFLNCPYFTHTFLDICTYIFPQIACSHNKWS